VGLVHGGIEVKVVIYDRLVGFWDYGYERSRHDKTCLQNNLLYVERDVKHC